MTRKVRERPRISTPRAFQEKGCWKMRWPRSPAKKSALGRSPPRAAKNRRWATLMSCASSTTAKSKTTFLLFEIAAASEVNSSACVISLRAFSPARTRSKMDHKHLALRLREPRLPAEARDIAIRLPVLQLPRIHHLLPFGEQKMQAELVAADGTRGLFQQLAHDLAAGDRRRPDVRLVEPKADGVERVNIDPLGETRFVAQQSLQLGLQRIRQRVGEGRQQDAGVGMRARQMGGPVQRHDGLARARRAGDARRAGVVALHPLPLLGVQEDRPLLPREIEGALQLLDVRHHAEAALGVGMIEGIRRRHGGLRHARLAARRQFQQRLRCLGGQMVGQGQQRVLGRLLDVVEPLGGHAVAEQFVVGHARRKGASSRQPASAPRQAPSARKPGQRSPSPSRVSRPTARRRSWDASPACAARPSRRPCRGGRRSRARGSRRSCERSAGCRCSPAPTRSSCPSPCRACGSSCRDWPG